MFLCIFVVGCPSKQGRISGVYFEGDRIPAKEELMIDQVYIDFLQEGKSPVIFEWDFESGRAYLFLQDRKNTGRTTKKYSFSFGKDDFEKINFGKIITCRATLRAAEVLDQFFLIEIDESKVDEVIQDRVYEFIRYDYRITHYDRLNILGRAYGAEMRLLNMKIIQKTVFNL